MPNSASASFPRPNNAMGIEVFVRYNRGATRTEVSKGMNIPDPNHDIKHMLERGILREEPGGRLFATR